MKSVLALLACLIVVACTTGGSQDGAEAFDTVLVPAPSIEDPAGPKPDELLHLAHADVRQILGEPEFVWAEADASMWRYRGPDCFVDVFLYVGLGVTFVDVHGEGLDQRARDACYRTLVKPTTS